MNIYAGSLSFQLTEMELRAAFEAFGTVSSARIIMDRYSGRSKGFGFVEMPNEAEAKAAIAGLNGKELKGRKVNISEARPQR
ncbi:MAG: RNA-binding protein [Euryarchaeota archaeon]|nr:RNA-binding protein [Euryarchaeota archaeon]